MPELEKVLTRTERLQLNLHRFIKHLRVLDNVGRGDCLWHAINAISNTGSVPVTRRAVCNILKSNIEKYSFCSGFGFRHDLDSFNYDQREQLRKAALAVELPEQTGNAIADEIFLGTYVPALEPDECVWGSDREIAAIVDGTHTTRGTIITLPKTGGPKFGIQLFQPGTLLRALTFTEFHAGITVEREDGSNDECYFAFRGDRTQVLMCDEGVHYTRLAPDLSKFPRLGFVTLFASSFIVS